MELVQRIYQIPIPLSGVKVDSARPATSIFKTKKDSPAPAIEQSALELREPFYINAYLIEGNNGNMLVDTGWNSPDAYSALTNELKNYGFTLKDISKIVLTHIHPDHCGLAGKIKQLSGAEISMDEREASLLKSRYVDVDGLIKETYDLLVTNGAPESDATTLSKASLPARELVVPISEYTAIKGGDKIVFEPFEFTVLSTLGHSPGHISLYEPNKKFLFTGDFILPEITPNISLHPQSSPNPLGDYLKSLEEAYELEVNFAFPGHGPAFSGVKQIIEAIVRHHEDRKRAVLKSIEGNTKTAYQVTQEIPWDVDINDGSYSFMSILNRRFAITETLAHLEYLVSQGEAGKTTENNKTVYFA
jgi:glyoxylase-like metal-dependent hydrolase (beta-lactamase superfamily II)